MCSTAGIDIIQLCLSVKLNLDFSLHNLFMVLLFQFGRIWFTLNSLWFLLALCLSLVCEPIFPLIVPVIVAYFLFSIPLIAAACELSQNHFGSSLWLNIALQFRLNTVLDQFTRPLLGSQRPCRANATYAGLSLSLFSSLSLSLVVMTRTFPV